ncbi:ABC transporter permease [Pseudonocardia humida]|uniref:Transport permease protein n=1 Tax=Pseudonocardia humida TaxID=2800819 RepID=A0ABT1A1A2_9PSEU|nr:ABC transporter permease [Pseudonocardia humida]MCO1656669.1 ABC transporter permease [Pseudonocardia humida]
MSAPTAPAIAARPRPWTDGSAAAARVLLKLRHDPAGIAITLASPVVLVLVFGYVFGSAIALPGAGDYREFLVPGLFATIAFNVVPAMITMARDSGRGVVDRFRSMPITRVAVPFGQAAANAAYGLLCLLLMAACAVVVGWRIRTGLGPALGALGLLAAFQFAATWIGMYLGLVIGREETAAQLSVLVFPVGMLSNVFVPTAGMPAWLRTIADWNPLSALTAAVRELCGNPLAPTNGAWPLEHPVLATLLWTALLLVVFVPLATVRYARPR